MQIALKYNIKLVMDGENGEFEYGGSTASPTDGFTKKDEKKYWFSDF